MSEQARIASDTTWQIGKLPAALTPSSRSQFPHAARRAGVVFCCPSDVPVPAFPIPPFRPQSRFPEICLSLLRCERFASGRVFRLSPRSPFAACLLRSCSIHCFIWYDGAANRACVAIAPGRFSWPRASNWVSTFARQMGGASGWRIFFWRPCRPWSLHLFFVFGQCAPEGVFRACALDPEVACRVLQTTFSRGGDFDVWFFLFFTSCVFGLDLSGLF